MKTSSSITVYVQNKLMCNDSMQDLQTNDQLQTCTGGVYQMTLISSKQVECFHMSISISKTSLKNTTQTVWTTTQTHIPLSNTLYFKEGYWELIRMQVKEMFHLYIQRWYIGASPVDLSGLRVERHSLAQMHDCSSGFHFLGRLTSRCLPVHLPSTCTASSQVEILCLLRWELELVV